MPAERLREKDGEERVVARGRDEHDAAPPRGRADRTEQVMRATIVVSRARVGRNVKIQAGAPWIWVESITIAASDARSTSSMPKPVAVSRGLARHSRSTCARITPILLFDPGRVNCCYTARR